MSKPRPVSPTTGGRSAMCRLAMVSLMLSSACTRDPPPAHESAPESRPAAAEEIEHPIDVAGHLAIAAWTGMQPLRGVWHWGVVPVGIAVGRDGSIYWTQYRTNSIGRAHADGSGIKMIAAVDGPLGLAVDRRSGELFYTSDRHYPRSIGRLQPGAQPEVLISGMHVNRPFAIALATSSARLYWTEAINGRIRSAGTDGSDQSTVFDDGIANVDETAGAVALASTGIAVDEQQGFLFWSDLRTGSIVRARLDGSDRKTILGRGQGLDFPTGLAIDAGAGKLYWADPGTETIMRADIDGSHPEIVANAADGVLEPYGLAIDPERRLLYWTDVAHNALYQIGVGQEQVERFVDLAAPSATTPQATAAADTCDAAVARARPEFLRRWVKLIRTCVIAVSATKAVLRFAADLRLAAGTCTRQLQRAHDVGTLRAALADRCDPRQMAKAVDESLDLGTAIIAADLPRAAPYLRAIRPFVAAERSADEPDTTAALASIDNLVARLERLDHVSASKIAPALPASGQTTSYRAFTRVAGGAATVPDDGAVRAGAPLAYIDNGDGTISDRNTGLMWEKKCDGCGSLHDFNTRYPWRAQDGETDVSTWLQAINAEDGVGFAGHSDWRLPEIGELLSIVNFEHFNPAVSGAFDGAGCGFGCRARGAPECSCTHLGAYWTAGNSPRPDDIVPVVGFHLGAVWGQSTDSDAFVRAVRGPIAERPERFADNGDGTISDHVTGLMWEKKCLHPGDLHDVDRRLYWSFDGNEETIWDWLAAINREGDGGFAGHDDWRIPNVKELYSLFDLRHRDPSTDSAFAGEGCADLGSPRCSLTADWPYWTSTTFADFPALALTVGFTSPGDLEDKPPPWVIRVTGGVEPHQKTLHMAVRAVRGPEQSSR